MLEKYCNKVIYLYDVVDAADDIRDERIWKVGNARMYAFFPPDDENTGDAVIICPGGAYRKLNPVNEGLQYARWFNTLGISAYVLLSRLPTQKDEDYPVYDMAVAITRIKNQHIGKIGVMGFSAGGHLAGLSKYFNDPPDFCIMVSAVTSMVFEAHEHTVKNLCRDNQHCAFAMSLENIVKGKQCPTFIAHAIDDPKVSISHALNYAKKLADEGNSIDLHLFSSGGHDFRLGSPAGWIDILKNWLCKII